VPDRTHDELCVPVVLAARAEAAAAGQTDPDLGSLEHEPSTYG
jgi:hypothetical protein